MFITLPFLFDQIAFGTLEAQQMQIGLIPLRDMLWLVMACSNNEQCHPHDRIALDDVGLEKALQPEPSMTGLLPNSRSLAA